MTDVTKFLRGRSERICSCAVGKLATAAAVIVIWLRGSLFVDVWHGSRRLSQFGVEGANDRMFALLPILLHAGRRSLRSR